MPVVVGYTTGQYLDIALTTVQYGYVALAVALIYVIGRIQSFVTLQMVITGLATNFQYSRWGGGVGVESMLNHNIMPTSPATC